MKKESKELASAINAKYGTKAPSAGSHSASSGQAGQDWKPIHQIHQSFQREDVLNFYRRADICLVTPLDDGKNLEERNLYEWAYDYLRDAIQKTR